MRFFFLFLLLSLTGFVRSQEASYGVTTALQTLPPFTQNISDWADPLNDKIGLTLLLNDRNEPGYQTQLQLTITGQGIRLQSRPDWAPTPINLSYGIPTQLTGTDLAEYFDLNNLAFSGISREQYLSQGGLPEGSYTVCFQAYDWIRGGEGPSSLPACAFVQARLLDPPIVLSPLGDQAVINPQALLVQWQARHTASFMTDYKVEIYEQQAGLSPEQIFALQQPYIETEVTGITSVLIDAAFPSLRQGVDYFLRVRASAPGGEAPFKNGGYSELAFFTYGTDCAPPTGITVRAENHQEAQLRWDFTPGASSYVVRYREQNPTAHWYEETTPFNFLRLTDLLDDTRYEVQLQSVCDGSGGAFGPTFDFTTPARPFDPANVDCGATVADLPLPTNTVPIARLAFGSRIKVGRFDFRVTEASPADGNRWRGKGEVDVPWLGLKLACTFDALSVNTDGTVFAGEVVALDNGLASVEGLVTKEEVIQKLGSATVDFCGGTMAAFQQSGGTPVSSDPASPEPREGASLPFVLGEGQNRIAFYGMKFGPTAAVMSAYSAAELPLGDRVVAFGVEAVNFQPGGLQGGSRLSLLTDVSFDWNGKMKFALKASENTFVGFDCSGITEVGLQMSVDFCREIVVPVDPATGKAATEGFVSATFTGRAPSWGEFAGQLSVSPFELPQLPGWSFTVEEALLDMADAATPAEVTFPSGYAHPDVSGGREGAASPAWKGFYLQLAQVSIPEEFTGGKNQNVTLGARQLIIDDTGFSGGIFGRDVLSLEQGRAGSWALSLAEVAISVQSNQFSAANLEGLIEVPAFDEPLAYRCNIQPGGEYAFSIAVEDELTMSALVAEVSLFANTEIGLAYDEAEDAFSAYAKLFGRASFSPKLGEGSQDKLNLPNIDFEDFHLTSTAPYLQNIGSWALSSEDEQPIVAGFPLQLNEVSMLHDPELEQVAFGVDLTVNLVGEKDKGFGANGRAFIICDVKVDESTQKQEWSFNQVRLDKLGLDYVGAGFEFHGFLQNFAGDPNFGSGFSGGIQASFKPGIEVGALAIFGQKNDFRYFFADAQATFDPGIAIGTTGMALYGFGGGVSYHMDRLGFESVTAPVSEAEGSVEEGAAAGAKIVPRSSLADAFRSGDPADGSPPPVEIPGELGISLSGVRYVPNAEVGLGLKAMVAFGTTKREVFNGDLTFEVLFNDDGALRQIGLLGNANFLTPPKSAKNPTPTPAIGALVDMTYDFQNEAFDAYLRLQAYINKGVISGAYPDFVAGEGKIHADAEDWYIHLGTPSQPIKLSYDLSKIANAGGKASSPPPGGQNPLADGGKPASTKEPLGQI
ncbi:MAG: fibronectin type III domain-containing protein, partial [Bacteroidota bacterium]